MNNILYTINELSVLFGKNYVVHDVSFNLEKGKIFCLVGESGSGKSMTALSLLKLLPEQARFQAKTFQFLDKNMLIANDKELYSIRGKEIAMIFQEPMTSLNPVFRVGDQVIEVLRYHLKVSKKQAIEKCEILFEQVGIAKERIKDYPHQLSGGMRQRVMIAMALACSPQLLIADEPTTALDVTIQGQILLLLKKLVKQNNMAMLFITHDLGVVSELADTIGVMYAGELVELANAKEFFQNPIHPYSKALLSCLPSLYDNPQRLNVIMGTVPKPSAERVSCAFMDRCPYKQEKCNKQQSLRKISDTRSVRCICV